LEWTLFWYDELSFFENKSFGYKKYLKKYQCLRNNVKFIKKKINNILNNILKIYFLFLLKIILKNRDICLEFGPIIRIQKYATKAYVEFEEV
jgi:hypothetical protein